MSRRRAGWVLLLGLAASLAGGPARAGWPESLFDEAGHDFGPVPRGAVVRHHFVLTNRLNETLSILDVRASCGCTTGRTDASVLSPGQRAVIEAQMDTRNFVGHKATQLIVTLITSQGVQGEVRLNVSSDILADIVLNPGTVDFGPVSKGQAPQLVLTIDRLGAPGWKAVRMVSGSRALTASLQETRRDAQMVSYRLTVGLKPDAPAGNLRDEIRIFTNDSESQSIPVPVSADVRGELTASPALLSLGNVATAAGVQGRYLIKGSKPFAITGIEGAGDGFSIAADNKESKPLHIVTLTYRPGESTTRGDLRRTFKVQTDLAGEPPVELNAALHVAP